MPSNGKSNPRETFHHRTLPYQIYIWETTKHRIHASIVSRRVYWGLGGACDIRENFAI